MSGQNLKKDECSGHLQGRVETRQRSIVAWRGFEMWHHLFYMLCLWSVCAHRALVFVSSSHFSPCAGGYWSQRIACSASCEPLHPKAQRTGAWLQLCEENLTPILAVAHSATEQDMAFWTCWFHWIVIFLWKLENFWHLSLLQAWFANIVQTSRKCTLCCKWLNLEFNTVYSDMSSSLNVLCSAKKYFRCLKLALEEVLLTKTHCYFNFQSNTPSVTEGCFSKLWILLGWRI